MSKIHGVIKDGRSKLSMFLTVLFRFEGIFPSKENEKIFSFDKNSTEDFQIIHFRNEVESEIAHRGLSWYVGFNIENSTVRDGSDVIINFLFCDFYKHRSKDIGFCLSPLKGETIKQIDKRCKKVFFGRNAIIKIIDEKTFEISYSQPSTTQKFFELISQMNWKCCPIIDNKIVCDFDTEIRAKEILPKKEFLPKKIKKNIELPLQEEINPILINESTLKVDVNLNRNLFSKEDALLELNLMYENKTIWILLSNQVQFEILNTLRNELKIGSLEEFAKYLLGSSNSLFTKEESLIELYYIYDSPLFDGFNKKIQDEVFLLLKEDIKIKNPEKFARILLNALK